MRAEIDFDVPEGYKPVAFRAPVLGELFIDSVNGGVQECSFQDFTTTMKRLIVEKIEPKRIILERVEESVKTPMQAKQGEFCEEGPDKGLMERTDEGYTLGKYIIWRRVEE